MERLVDAAASPVGACQEIWTIDGLGRATFGRLCLTQALALIGTSFATVALALLAYD